MEKNLGNCQPFQENDCQPFQEKGKKLSTKIRKRQQYIPKWNKLKLHLVLHF